MSKIRQCKYISSFLTLPQIISSCLMKCPRGLITVQRGSWADKTPTFLIAVLLLPSSGTKMPPCPETTGNMRKSMKKHAVHTHGTFPTFPGEAVVIPNGLWKGRSKLLVVQRMKSQNRAAVCGARRVSEATLRCKDPVSEQSFLAE